MMRLPEPDQEVKNIMIRESDKNIKHPKVQNFEPFGKIEKKLPFLQLVEWVHINHGQ